MEGGMVTGVGVRGGIGVGMSVGAEVLVDVGVNVGVGASAVWVAKISAAILVA